MNGFVGFLNSMHSVTGNSMGALAERQVTNQFAQKCHVPRKVGKYILDEIKSGKKIACIITGHAGDGKTSILVQLLRDLGMLPENETLKKYDECVNEQNQRLLYVKDMSEIALGERKELLKRALSAPALGSCSVLVSNTGPLLTAFDALLIDNAKEKGESYSEEQSISDQTILLNQMDQNTSSTCHVGDYEFLMINIARIDNTSFATEFLKKALQQENWTDCNNCANKEKCPVLFNSRCLLANQDRVFEFIESYYRYMYEYDQRMTIRQIQSHLCYAITGGLTCDKVLSNHKDLRIRYNFANLFFGYHDKTFQETAKEIKAVQQLDELGLDAKNQDDDYTLFVKEDYSVFPEDVRSILEKYAKKQLLHAYSLNSDWKDNEVAIAVRKMVRRFYLMYSSSGKKALEKILNNCYGDGFTEYVEMIKNPDVSIIQKRKMRDAVFQALYMDNTGFLPKKENDWLPLTLHRNDSTFQSVLLVLGEIKKEDFSIVQKPLDSKMNDIENEQAVFLCLNKNNFLLNLPLYQYFENRKNGVISSIYNPSLTHNIANLETFLNNNISSGSSDSIKLLCNTTQGQKMKTVYYDDNNTRLIT